MRYRFEVEDGTLVVRNVEADVEAAEVECHCAPNPHDPNGEIVTDCSVVTVEGWDFGRMKKANPQEAALQAAADFDASRGFPSLKQVRGRCDPHRIEFKLGTLMADAASAIARAVIEHVNGGVKAETKAECSSLIAQLHQIWYASLFGSYDSERWLEEPYFCSLPTFGPRMGFAAAARDHGMWELQMRFPDLSEAELKVALSWPLDVLRQLLDSIVPPQRTFEVVERCAASCGVH
jgi:hypothetical protein